MGNQYLKLTDEEIKTIDDIIYILYQRLYENMNGERKKKIKRFEKQRDLLIKIKKNCK